MHTLGLQGIVILILVVLSFKMFALLIWTSDCTIVIEYCSTVNGKSFLFILHLPNWLIVIHFIYFQLPLSNISVSKYIHTFCHQNLTLIFLKLIAYRFQWNIKFLKTMAFIEKTTQSEGSLMWRHHNTRLSTPRVNCINLLKKYLKL